MWTRYFVNALLLEILCSEKWMLDASLLFDYGTQRLLLLELLENVPNFLLNSTCRLTVWIWTSRTYIGFGVLAAKCVWDRAEGLLKRGARNASDTWRSAWEVGGGRTQQQGSTSHRFSGASVLYRMSGYVELLVGEALVIRLNTSKFSGQCLYIRLGLVSC
jgi:hypothetical protein